MRRKAVPLLVPSSIFDEVMEATKAFTPRLTGSVRNSIITISTTSKLCYLDELWCLKPQIEAWRVKAEEFMKPEKVVFI